jgi:capsule polysaccharide export protein KpsE/RkpR
MLSDFRPSKSSIDRAEVVDPNQEGRLARPVVTAWIRMALEGAPPIRNRAVDIARSYISFWYVIAFVAVCASIYFYGIADRLYVSEASVSIRNQGESTSGIGAILSSGIFGSSAGSDEQATLTEFIESREMLNALDKKLHLRQAYSSSDWNIFARMRSNASAEDFLTFYLSTLTVTQRTDVGIVEIAVADPNAKRAQAIAQEIVTNSESFMNRMSDRMRDSTLRYAREEFETAMKAVAASQPADREVAEMRLQSARTNLATLLNTTNQQQVYIVRISEPSLATMPTLPMRLIDVLGTIVVAAALYFILYLVWQNVRDHRRV